MASTPLPAAAGGATPEAAIDPTVVQQASIWMARLWSDEAGDGDRAACARWRAQHPDHERAWKRLEVFEDKLSGVPQDIARRVLREPAVSAARRRALQLLGLGLATSGITVLARDTETWHILAAEQASGTGEIRTLDLPDGTRVTLGSASAFDLRFSGHERLLVLRAGEIMIATAPDPAPAHRPFRVLGRHGTLEALGTRFSVRQDDETSRLAVFEGAVEIRPASAPGDSVRVDAGQGAAYSAHGVLGVQPVADSAAAWTRGMLVADGMRVDDFIAELSRYRRGVLRCTQEAASLKVTGVFPLQDTDRALYNLTLVLPVATVSRTRYWVTVQAR